MDDSAVKFSMLKHHYASYFALFSQINWQTHEEFPFSAQWHPNWLLEQGSLSQLFAQQCQELKACLSVQTSLSFSQLTPFQTQQLFPAMSEPQSCLLREVILIADDEPWLLGSTLIPFSSLADEDIDLSQQGDVPLGLTVFQAQDVHRDALHLGNIRCDLGNLVARSSRLWMNQKPMLVSELFLPASPIYVKDKS